MQKKDILKRYGSYYDYLQTLGKRELKENVALNELGLSRGAIQAGYKEMKEIGFDGQLVHYLCYISALYLIDLSSRESPSAIQTVINIIRDYPLNKEDTINLLRIFKAHPDMIINALIGTHSQNYIFQMPDRKPTVNGKETLDPFRLHMILSGLWYLFYERGVMINGKPKEQVFDKESEYESEMLNIISKFFGD